MLATVVEDPFHVASNFARMRQPANDAERQAIPHNVGHQGPTAERLEAVGVMPQPVRAAQLHIDKTKRRLPARGRR